MLDKQFQCYSVSTNDFNTPEEQDLFDRLGRYRRWKRLLGEARDRMKAKNAKPRGCTLEDDDITGIHKAIDAKYKSILKSLDLNKRINETKEEYCEVIKHNTLPRTLHPEALNEYHQISIFESTLSRIAGFEINKITKDLIVVETYFYDITKQNVLNGFYLEGEKYCYLYSSAGEIRRKKTVFIREELCKRIEKTLRCGLTLEKINEKGGLNPNKYLAYTALSSSATDWWNGDARHCRELGLRPFNIDRMIVVDDFETCVTGMVDYIDDVKYTITRQEASLPITHTDGAGVISPACCKRSLMIRMPWIKGALCSWNFRGYIKDHGYSPIITDIYGTPHDIFEEDIYVILTKSQFKLWKFYDDWEDYKRQFKENGCQAGVCNIEPINEKGKISIPSSAINYQELQTLIDFTEEDLDSLVKSSNNTLSSMASDKMTMLRVFGADEYNQNKNAYQTALSLYPELLKDDYSRYSLRQIKKSLEKRYKSGKLEVKGKYTFIFPDWTAVFDNWFGHIDDPIGLLDDGEVFCGLYKGVEELDCLRSPHLFMEHAVRKNKVNEETIKWFGRNACLFTSCKDFISRILQFDVDGDKSLVVADQSIVRLAKHNMEKYDIVPLYYEMKKANPVPLTPESIYEGLEAGFKHSNIGIFSNNISKIWNTVDWQHETDENIKHYMDLIRFLCAENNFVIDAAKTLYVPTRPDNIDQMIKDAIKTKVPHYFIYAKSREGEKVAEKTDSLVNRLEDKIINPRLSFTASDLGTINYRYMMNNEQIRIDNRVIDMYKDVGSKYHFRLSAEREEDNVPINMDAVVVNIRREFQNAFPEYSLSSITDMIVKYLWAKKKNVVKKDMFWQVFGDFVVSNLRRKIPKHSIMCDVCGARFVPASGIQKTCPKCQKVKIKAIKRDYMRRIRQERKENVNK